MTAMDWDDLNTQPMQAQGSKRPKVNLARSLHMKPSQSGPGVTLQEKIAQKEIGITKQIIERAMAISDNHLQERLRAQQDKLWQTERDAWLQAVLGKSSNDKTTTTPLIESQNQQSWPLSVQGRPHTAPLQARAHLEVLLQMQDASAVPFLQLFPAQLSTTDAGYRSAWQLVFHLTQQNPGSNVGAWKHLCVQFQQLILERVGTQAKTVYSENWANLCSAFADLVVTDSDGSQTIWPTVFFCLRCGEVQAAREVYEKGPSNGSLKQALDTLTSPPSTPVTVVMANTPDNVFENAVYALLSREVDLPQQDVPGLMTMEDHVAAALWKVLMGKADIVEVADMVRELGTKHFGNGWAFVQPLLLTGQYASALKHVTDTEGLCQAAHLAYVMHTCDVDVCDGEGTRESSSETVSSMLAQYADELQDLAELGRNAAMEYIVRIPDLRRSRSEAARLISTCTGRAFDELAGTVGADGKRNSNSSSVVIDRHFTADIIRQVLGEAADMIVNKSQDKTTMGTAVMSFLLAERYDDVLNLLSRLLSPPEKYYDPDRAFWYQESQRFRQRFLETGSHVIRTLEHTGKTQAAETHLTMMQLNLFFHHARHPTKVDVGAAWAIMDSLQLVPMNRDEMMARQNSYRDLDSFIQDAMPEVFLACMELLTKEHQQLKKDIREKNKEVAKQRLEQIKIQANLILSLSGMLGIRDNASKMLLLESGMI